MLGAVRLENQRNVVFGIIVDRIVRRVAQRAAVIFAAVDAFEQLFDDGVARQRIDAVVRRPIRGVEVAKDLGVGEAEQ